MTIRIGTDCSGIEAPIQALQQLNIPFKHSFASDIDKYCIQSIKANYKPEILFGDPDGPFPCGDITKRNINDVPNIDLYVCGFPCQPFSQAGKRKGLDDKRGNVFWSCIEVIEQKQPTYFILENVRGILSNDSGKTWDIIWNALKTLEQFGYYIDWKVLNTKDYGISQSRNRVFIVGTKDKPFIWPEKIKMDDIKNYVDWGDTIVYHTRRNIDKYPETYIFVDVNFQQNTFINSSLYACCLNTNTGLWCVPQKRFANTKEYLMLQGFNVNFNQVVSKTQLKKQIGNSMSVNVLKSLFLEMGVKCCH